MNHDITHCKSENCPKKEKCYRYVALRDVNKPHYISMFNGTEVCINDNYKYFMEL